MPWALLATTLDRSLKISFKVLCRLKCPIRLDRSLLMVTLRRRAVVENGRVHGRSKKYISSSKVSESDRSMKSETYIPLFLPYFSPLLHPRCAISFEMIFFKIIFLFFFFFFWKYAPLNLTDFIQSQSTQRNP